MIDRYDPRVADEHVRQFPDLPSDLIVRVYSTRLIGSEPRLVLHGGGNTSVKIAEQDLLGRERNVLYVKGSGRDMAHMEPGDFSRLNLDALLVLRNLPGLSDDEMENQLLTARIGAYDPPPSVDAWVHAFLPHPFVDHTHADAVLILTNQDQGADHIREALGPDVAVIDYVHPGFALGRAAAEAVDQQPEASGLVVRGHGLFTWGRDAAQAYHRMIGLANRAEAFIAARHTPPAAIETEPDQRTLARIAQVIRGEAARLAGCDEEPFRFQAEIRTDPDLRAASALPQAAEFAASGPLTPDHAIRTRNRWLFLGFVPEDDEALRTVVRRAMADFAREYQAYFNRGVAKRSEPAQPMDSSPRVVLAAGLGIIALGETRTAARIAADIAEATLRAKVQALAVGPYRPLSEDHLFDMEYWPLQLKKKGPRDHRPLLGRVAVVTGAGGAIGLGVADRLLEAGADVALTDVSEERLAKAAHLLGLKHGPERLAAVPFDITRMDQVENGFDAIGRLLGGLDILVPNAGIAHVARIEDLDTETVSRVMAVNFLGVFHGIKAAVPIFRRQGTGGHVVIISSKNVFDPGASFSAYSSSKAAAHQMGKIAAMELAPMGVRVNMINPDAVFGCGDVSSGLWDLVGPDRMRSRGLDPSCMADYYRDRNLLKARVTAEHVGNAVVFFASDLVPTTGATLPVDGGVTGAFPR